MTMKGISFTAPLVQALLAGRKTQTRRIIQPYTDADMKPGDVVLSWPKDQFIRSGLQFRPPYTPGDRLYVREGIERTDDGGVAYRADGAVIPGAQWRWKPRTLPGRYMPKELARIILTVTDVRVERLRDIGETDAMAEGIRFYNSFGNRYFAPPDLSEKTWNLWPQAAFARLWDSVQNRDGERWDDNPWVAAITFTVERKYK